MCRTTKGLKRMGVCFVRFRTVRAHVAVLSAILAFVLALPGTLVAASLPEGLSGGTVLVDGLRRHFLVYKAAPHKTFGAAVILLHGGGQSMRKLFAPDRAGTRKWLDIAEQHNILLIVPNGTNAKTGDTEGDRQSWNDLRRSRSSGNSTSDDVKFISILIEMLASEITFERTQIYVTGASNGGMMTFRLLIERPERFAAGVAFIANLPKEEIARARAPTPIMIMNGTEDNLILYNGGPVAGGRRGETRSTDATLEYWIDVNGADRSGATTRALPDLEPEDGCRLIETLYPAKPRGANVAFIKMDGGGHTIPAKNARSLGWMADRILGTRCRDADGAELAWAFMNRHKLAE